MRHLAFAALALIALPLVAIACGDDDDGGSNGNGDSVANDPNTFLVATVEGLIQTQADHIRASLNEGDPATLEEQALQDMLTAMVLQPEDVPEGLQNLGGSFSTNEQSASGLGSGPSKEQLDEWGRILGYSTDYQRANPAAGANIRAVRTSISVYEDADGATLSFDDRIELARGADWRQSHPELEEFETTELTPEMDVDGLYWIRISGYQQTGANSRVYVTDDQIVFRIGQAWGFLNAVAAGPEV